MITVKKEGKGRIFETPILEVFTKTNPIIHVCTYGGAISIFAYLSQVGWKHTALFALIGLATWTLVEYLMHRFLFHIKPGKFQYMVHGIHHEYPKDKERLMMPPLPGIIFVLAFFAIWYVIFQSYTYGFMAGFLLGYLGYTYIHYIIHTHKPVKGLKFLWANHLKHHNPRYHDKAFGVSSPLWDYVFGTMPKSNKHETKA